MAESTNKETVVESDEDSPRPPPGELPATYIDTWHVSTWKGHMRVTFGEEIGHVRYLRSAIVLTLDDAEMLGRMMLDMAGKRRKKEQETD
jgi:hypothetical protein